MHAGRLCERITIRRKVATRDATGGEIVTWEDDATVWAAADPINGREYTALLQAEASIDVRFTIHYRTGISSDSRVIWRTETYELVGPPIDVRARKIWHELNCRTAQDG